MLRQIHIFHKGTHIYTYSFAIAFGKEELEKVEEVIQDFFTMPIPGKTLHRPLSNYQIFHQGKGEIYFLFVADLIDSISYMERIIRKTIQKFSELFPNPLEIKEESAKKQKFIDFLNALQQEMHSKIVIAGPIQSGKTTLYELLKSNDEKSIMNFAKSSTFVISNLSFDIWDFQLKDNFSLLWSKFLTGSDLIILLIDASNFNLKVINHFLSFQKKEARFSKFLYLANKSDMVNKTEIEKIKQNLNFKTLQSTSFINAEALKLVTNHIREILGLRQVLPANFETLIKEAETLEVEKKIVSAIAKYKELIQICNEYQDFSYINTFKQKVEELTTQIRKHVEEKKEIERRKKFEVPEEIQFRRKVQVKSLPKSSLKPIAEIQKEIKESAESGKSKLSAMDFKIDLDPLRKEEEFKQKIIEGSKKQKIPVKPEDLKTEEDYPKGLQKMIQNRGSFLSLKLCTRYLEEVKEVLGRPLTFDDLVNLADQFVQKET